MNKKFILILSNIMFLFNFNLLDASCDSNNPLIREETIGSLSNLVSTLNKGVVASQLSVHNTRNDGFELLKRYVQKVMPLVILEWKQLNSEKKLSYKKDDINNIFNLKLILGAKNISVVAKLINVSSELQFKIANFTKKWNSIIFSHDLDNWDTWESAFHKVIINHHHLTHPEYGFKKENLSLKIGTNNTKLKIGDNNIFILIKLDDCEAKFHIRISGVKNHIGEIIYQKMANLIIVKNEITHKHKTKYLLQFLNEKLKEKTSNTDIYISEIIKINGDQNRLYSGKNSLLVKFKDGFQREHDYIIFLDNVAFFWEKYAFQNLVSIFNNLKTPFILKQNDKWDDLKKMILENEVINDAYLFNVPFSLKLHEVINDVDTKTITNGTEVRQIAISFKVNETESEKIFISYQVIASR